MNKDLYFEYIEDFADYIVSEIEDEELFVAVVGKFDSIKLLLKEVMAYDFVDFENIEIESKIMDGYTDEFVLSLWADEDVLKVGCEKLKRDGEYISPCGDKTYLMEDCSSKVIPLCEDSDLYFVNFDVESNCCDDCDECCSCCCCGDRETVDADEAYYTINGKPVTRVEFDMKCNEVLGKIDDWFCLVCDPTF